MLLARHADTTYWWAIHSDEDLWRRVDRGDACRYETGMDRPASLLSTVAGPKFRLTIEGAPSAPSTHQSTDSCTLLQFIVSWFVS